MALIPCPECKREVSSTAAACPSCGAPIAERAEAAAAGTRLQTVQETSKRFKAQILIASLIFWAGVVWFFTAGNADESGMLGISLLMIVVGMVYYVIVKAQIWWHHK